jgi:hypothetical protein
MKLGNGSNNEVNVSIEMHGSVTLQPLCAVLPLRVCVIWLCGSAGHFARTAVLRLVNRDCSLTLFSGINIKLGSV